MIIYPVRVRAALALLALALPVVGVVAATPQFVVDELLAADRAFSPQARRPIS